MMKTALVTGTNRGLGLGFVQELLLKDFQVIATVRDLSTANELQAIGKKNAALKIIEADVSLDEVKAQLETALKDISQIDLLINNAGVAGKSQRFESLSTQDIARVFNTNVLGNIRVTQSCLPWILKSSQPKIIHISSKMGSIADNNSGGSYGYRPSKAALNIVNKSFAIDHPQIISVVLHPGWVQTDMGGKNALIDVKTSITGMIKVIDSVTLKDSGKFYDYSGVEIPW